MKEQQLNSSIQILKRQSDSLVADILEKKAEIERLEQIASDRQKELSQQYEKIQQERDEVLEKTRILEENQKKFDTVILEKKAKISKLEKEVSLLILSKSRWNDEIVYAESRLDGQRKELEDLEKLIESKKTVLLELDEKQKELHNLKGKISDAQAQLHHTIEQNTRELMLTRQEVDAEKKRMEEYIQKKERAEIEYYDARERKIKIEHDLEVYISRARRYYEKAFPDLEMKL